LWSSKGRVLIERNKTPIISPAGAEELEIPTMIFRYTDGSMTAVV
jgi:hypothetical protein